MRIIWKAAVLTEKRMDQRHIVVHVHAILAGPVIDSCEVVAAVLSMKMGQRPLIIIYPVKSHEGDIGLAHENHSDI